MDSHQWRSQTLYIVRVSIWQTRGARAYSGGLRQERGPLAKAPEAETLLAFGRQMEAANLPTFLKFEKGENHRQIFVLCRQNGESYHAP